MSLTSKHCSFKPAVDACVAVTARPGDDCHAFEFKCSTGNQCIPASYQCDEETDCQDRSDEIGCCRQHFLLNLYILDSLAQVARYPRAAVIILRTCVYRCVCRCIPTCTYICLELGAYSVKICVWLATARPTVVVNPPPEVLANEGQTITITCEALGIPTPLIIWRLNWGHVGKWALWVRIKSGNYSKSAMNFIKSLFFFFLFLS